MLDKYLDVPVDYVLAVAKVQSISDGQYDLGYLTLILASVQVVFGVELSAFTVLHDDIKEPWIIVNFVDLNNIGMFELSQKTKYKE
jgi:hypothetical protein